MAALASLAMLGSARPNSSLCFNGSPAVIRQFPAVRVSGVVPSGSPLGGQRWDCTYICRCAVTTEPIAELGNSVSAESTAFRGSGDGNDLVLKPAPRPVLKPPPKAEVTLPWAPAKPVRDLRREKSEDKEKVIESLGEVLEKAEKLEAANLRRLDSNASNTSSSNDANGKSAIGINSNPGTGADINPKVPRKSKTLKNVWTKGDPIAVTKKVVKEAPKFEKTIPEVDAAGKPEIQSRTPPMPQTASKTEIQSHAPPRPQPASKAEIQSLTPPRPQPPSKVEPRLQSKPSIAAPPVLKKPILKDVGAAPRPTVSEGVDAEPKTRERKPILVDKFASKKPTVDPSLAETILRPPEPVKSSYLPTGKVERRKKAGTSGLRRRLVEKNGPDEDLDEVSLPGAQVRKGRKWSKASRKVARMQAARAGAPTKVDILEVGEEGMSMQELAKNLAVSEADVFGFLFSRGVKTDRMSRLDKDMVKTICKWYDVEVLEADPIKVEDMARKKSVLDEEDLDKLEVRPPVLTIMGHVDHGKVVASEAGGITQGIGAYKVLVPIDGKVQPCVFLDTPGHEAFGAMRARGARVTDIVIIVVAADDGVRPQTNEAIAHAKAAGVPIVVAINKIDKDGASPERVMQEFSSVGLMPEDWGGDIPMISARNGENVDVLLETIMLIAELQELKANPHRNAKGTIIEAGLDKSKGPVATFIVQNGTIRKGDVVVCGEAFGKVRALFDDKGSQVNEAGPSIAVQVIGLNSVPIAGDEFEVVDSLDIAREKADARAGVLRLERIYAKVGERKVTLSSLASAASRGKQPGLDVHELNLILKVDVQGSIEAIRQALQVLPQENIMLRFLLQAPGDVSMSDVDLAVASKAVIFGFNVKVPGPVKSHADNKGVEIRTYRIIYELIDEMRNAMEGLLDPVEEKTPIGSAEVRAVFTSGSRKVAGCMVMEGKVVKDCDVQIIRKGKTVYSGTIDSLRQVKEAVKEVDAGLECGIGVDGFMDWEEGDLIEAFNTVKKQRTLEEASSTMAAALARTRVV
ncbi:hypothetical protein ACLOJK_021771 [Asimina triloba]